ncbi:MAG: adenylate/guanylate cyclase domain-containing protein, partial [Anaerolineales bacterium]
MAGIPSGTVTFLFTDIEGSTKLAREHPNKWETLRERHHAILKSAIELHNGYVFQIIGDAFCAAFHTAGDALRAAVKSQIDLHSENWGDAPVKVRMGIHTGKAEIQEHGQYHGYLAMSRIQRLMSAGHGGQVLISAATQELLLDELPEDVSLRDLGERRLKDLIR